MDKLLARDTEAIAYAIERSCINKVGMPIHLSLHLLETLFPLSSRPRLSLLSGAVSCRSKRPAAVTR